MHSELMKTRQEPWDRLIVNFLHQSKNTAFYGTILTNLELDFTVVEPKVSISQNLKLYWHPLLFDAQSWEQKRFALRLAVEHIARLHHLRMGSRKPGLWEQACMIEITNDLFREGYQVGNNQYMPEFFDKSAEEIYEYLEEEEEKKNDSGEGQQSPDQSGANGQGGGGGGDNSGDNHGEGGSDGDAEEEDESGGSGEQPDPNAPLKDTLSNDPADPKEGTGSNNGKANDKTAQLVSKALQTAKATGTTFGSKAAGYSYLLNEFFKPQIKWEQYVRQWMTEALNKRESFNRRNRRFPGVYMPGRIPKDGALTACNMYLDVSGSVSDEMITRFASEGKYIHERLKPSKLRLVQFDTEIQEVLELTPFSKYEQLQITGRGGTDLRPVREHIIETKAKLVIILTDMYCNPMEPIPGVDIVWIVYNNKNPDILQGKVIHAED